MPVSKYASAQSILSGLHAQHKRDEERQKQFFSSLIRHLGCFASCKRSTATTTCGPITRFDKLLGCSAPKTCRKKSITGRAGNKQNCPQREKLRSCTGLTNSKWRTINFKPIHTSNRNVETAGKAIGSKLSSSFLEGTRNKSRPGG